MQEVWQAHCQDPENFDLDEFNHPWSEQGPSGELIPVRADGEGCVLFAIQVHVWRGL